MQRVMIDTDPGVDDSLALLYAVRSNGFDIAGITTVYGTTDRNHTTANAYFVMRKLLRSDAPIAAGSERPLSGVEYKAPTFHGPTGLGEFELTPDPAHIDDTAVDRIIELARKYGSDISLITLGPLTNIARACDKDIDAMRSLRSVYTMGGAIQSYGNASRVAEFNLYQDPEAASRVFDVGMPITLVPINITRRAWLPEDSLRMLPDDFQKISSPILSAWKQRGQNGIYLHDPLTVVLSLDQSHMETTEMDIRVETGGAMTRGMCVPELRPWQEAHPNVAVVTDIDAEYYVDRFLRTVTA